MEKIIDFLLDKKVNLNVYNNDGWTPLYALFRFNKSNNIMKKLIKNGADVNLTVKERSSVIWLAVIQKNLNMVKFLVKHGADVNVKDNGGNSLLYWANFFKNKNMSEYLKSVGAKDDTNEKYKDNEWLEIKEFKEWLR